MKIVLDASAALEIAGGRPQAERFAGLIVEAEIVLAPELLLVESGNALWKLWRFSTLNMAEIPPLLFDIQEMVDEWYPLIEIYNPATVLAVTQGVTVYDACYLYLAGSQEASLLTLDKKMAEAGRQLGITLL